jgi:hypothetical protein
LSTAGSQTIWLCNYDELFAYGRQFELNHLLNCGDVLATRLNGLASGAVHWLAEAGMIFLAPLIAIGLWRERRERLFQAAVWYALLLFVSMTLIFTFAGDRGGLFHSTGALLPFFYAAAPIGLDTVVDWIARRRRSWKAATAKSVFSAAFLAYAVLLSFFVYRGRVIGFDWSDPIWNQSDRVYSAIGRWLDEQGEIDPIVMVNNPPGFTYQTGLRSIVVPYGDEIELLKAADQFGARWLVLDANRPAQLAAVYEQAITVVRLKLRQAFDSVRIYEIGSP